MYITGTVPLPKGDTRIVKGFPAPHVELFGMARLYMYLLSTSRITVA